MRSFCPFVYIYENNLKTCDHEEQVGLDLQLGYTGPPPSSTWMMQQERKRDVTTQAEYLDLNRPTCLITLWYWNYFPSLQPATFRSVWSEEYHRVTSCCRRHYLEATVYLTTVLQGKPSAENNRYDEMDIYLPLPAHNSVMTQQFRLNSHCAWIKLEAIRRAWSLRHLDIHTEQRMYLSDQKLKCS